MSEPAQDDTKLENQNAETIPKMVAQEGWIRDRLKPGHKFTTKKATWRSGKLVWDNSEKPATWELSGEPINEAPYSDFSRAVYECTLKDGGGEKMPSRAVVKVWMQTRKTRDSPNSSDSGYASHPDWELELQALAALKHAAERSKEKMPYRPFPYALGLCVKEQGEYLPVKGGYLVYLVMEKLPGDHISPDDFWGKWDKTARNRFRDAFIESYRLIERLGIEPNDKAMRNLLYYRKENRKEGRCYLIDWENWQECDPDDPYPHNSLLLEYGMIGDRGQTMGDQRWNFD
ncbi:hypothetical protein ACMFMG_001720 [Clarireedia jacksonii]